VSIDAGGFGGGDFIADSYGSGGGTDTIPAGTSSYPNFVPLVANPIPATVWNTARVGESRYSVPGLIPGGSYQARLYFMDWSTSTPAGVSSTSPSTAPPY
jgi:hypothetical protein